MRFSIIVLIILASCVYQSDNISKVRTAGAMRNVMWKGQLEGTIALDSLQGNYYGVGPLEFLRGELLMFNGKIIASSAISDSTMKVEEVAKANAPFFVYAEVSHWKEIKLPDSITTLKILESYLLTINQPVQEPFVFMLNGTINEAIIHVVNLPVGKHVSSPQEAHEGQVNYILKNEKIDLVGFFSTKHKGIFTHHDSNVHMHLITRDQKKMGHLDNLKFTSNALTLLLPD